MTKFHKGTTLYKATGDCFHQIGGIGLRVQGGQSFRTNKPIPRHFRKWNEANDGPPPEKADFEDIDRNLPEPEDPQVASYKIEKEHIQTVAP